MFIYLCIFCLGENDLDVVSLKILLANLFVEERELDDAKELLLEALECRKRILGVDHDSVQSLRARIDEIESEIISMQFDQEEVAPPISPSRAVKVSPKRVSIHSLEMDVKKKKESLGNLSNLIYLVLNLL